MPLPLKDVGEGFSILVYCQQWKPKEPHLNKVHEVAGPTDQSTPAVIHHQVASPRMRSLRRLP